MIKFIGLLKRRQGMTPTEFREYYETYHRQLGEKYLSGFATKYMRRYMQPVANPISGEPLEQDYDVILEIWYPDQASYDKANEQFSRPEVAAEIVCDEEKLFDRDRNRFFHVEEVISALS